MKIYEAKDISDEIHSAFVKFIPQLSSSSPVPGKSDLEEIVKSNNTKLFIAEDESILGTLTLVFNKTPTGKKVWIEDVIVDSEARGRGVGKELTRFAIEYAYKRGIKKIDLTSSPDRIAANKLYQKLGFSKRETNVYRLTL